jgi:hypothetical protein
MLPLSIYIAFYDAWLSTITSFHVSEQKILIITLWVLSCSHAVVVSHTHTSTYEHWVLCQSYLHAYSIFIKAYQVVKKWWSSKKHIEKGWNWKWLAASSEWGFLSLSMSVKIYIEELKHSKWPLSLKIVIATYRGLNGRKREKDCKNLTLLLAAACI